jgi:hypothetical protein
LLLPARRLLPQAAGRGFLHPHGEKELLAGAVGKTGTIGAICRKNAANFFIDPNDWAKGWPWRNSPAFLSVRNGSEKPSLGSANRVSQFSLRPPDDHKFPVPWFVRDWPAVPLREGLSSIMSRNYDGIVKESL